MSDVLVYYKLSDTTYDITKAVLSDNFAINYKFASSNFHYAQTVCNLTLHLESLYSLYPSIDIENSGGIFYVEKNSQRLFTGKISQDTSKKLSSYYTNSLLELELTDTLLDLDIQLKEDEELAYRNFKILDNNDKAHSIIHQVMYYFGFTDSDISSSVNITDVVEGIVFTSTNSILQQLDMLLYEYGYVLLKDEYDRIAPKKYLYAQGEISATTLTANDIFDDINLKLPTAPLQIGTYTITYNKLYEKSNVMLYRDNLPYNSDGTFAGYIIPSGYFYPIEANVIDTETGDYQKVYQEYTDTALKALTNKAIVDKLDFELSVALKAFKSDFSDIVLTSGHTIDAQHTGLTLDVAEFYNRKARIRWKNNTSGNVTLYYFNIYGNVLYKGENNYVDVTYSGINQYLARKTEEYTCQFISTAAKAEQLGKFLLYFSSKGVTEVTFESSNSYAIGSFVNMSNIKYLDANKNIFPSIQYWIIISKRYDVEKNVYSYTAYSYDWFSSSYSIKHRITNQSTDINTDKVSLELSKPSLFIPCDADGSNPNFTNAIVDYKVLLNGLNVTSGWNFNITYTNCSGILNITNKTVTINSISADTASFELFASNDKYSTISRVCSLYKLKQGEDGSAGINARTVMLTISGGYTQVVQYNEGGASPNPSSLTFIATAYNTQGTVYYEFLVNGASMQNTTANSYIYTVPIDYANMPKKIEVKIRENSSLGTVVASDLLTIYGVKNNSQAVTIVVSNQAHTVPADTNGNVLDMTKSGTNIYVYRGTTQCTFVNAPTPLVVNTFTISTPVIIPSGALTFGGFSGYNTTVATVNAHSNMSSSVDTVVLDYTVKVASENFIVTTYHVFQTITKSKKGEQGQQGEQGVRAPNYLGRYTGSHPTSVNGDWWIYYATSDTPIKRGVYYNNNGTPTRISIIPGDDGYTTNSDLLSRITQTLADMAWIEDISQHPSYNYGTSSNYGLATFFNSLGAVTAFIQKLFGQEIIVGSAGFIRTSNYQEQSGKPIAGFKLDYNTSSIKACNVYISGKAEMQEIVMANVTAGQNVVKADISEKIITTVSGDKYYVPAGWHLMKSLQLAATGSVNIEFTAKSAGSNVQIKLCRNNDSFVLTNSGGQTVYTPATTYTTYYYNNISVTAGDVFMIYGYVLGSGSTLYVKDYKLKITENPGILTYLGTSADSGAVTSAIQTYVQLDESAPVLHYPMFVSDYGTVTPKIEYSFSYMPSTDTLTVGNIASSGLHTASKYSSTVTNEAPFIVSSTTKVINLNVDLLDDMHASSSNTGSTIVSRDASGNFSAGTITATLNGNANTATTLQTSRTIWGQNFNGSANVTGNMTVSGNILSAYHITPAATNTYDLGSSSLKFKDVYISGIIYGATFSGNALTATKLATARLLWGQSFDGSADVTGNISVSGNISNTYAITPAATNTYDLGSSSLKYKDGYFTGVVYGTTFSGNALTASKLATARLLWGQSFDGSTNVIGNMTISGNISNTYNVIPDTTNTYDIGSSSLKYKDGYFTGIVYGTTFSGNALTASKLATARLLWGQSFDGSTNVIGNMTISGNLNAVRHILPETNAFYTIGNQDLRFDSSYINYMVTKNIGISNYPNTAITIDTISGNMYPILGTPLDVSTGWTTTGWTGTYASGFTHTTGNTNPLYVPITVSSGTFYTVVFTISNITAGSIRVSFCGQEPDTAYSSNTTVEFTPIAFLNETSNLSFIPTSDFNGTISNITVTPISSAIYPIISIRDTWRNPIIDIRGSVFYKSSIFIGTGGKYLTSGDGNLGIGIDALRYISSGRSNLGIGTASLSNATTASFNIGLGYDTLYKTTVGHRNVAIGYRSLYFNVIGSDNVGIGHAALLYSTGSNNTAVGTRALYRLTYGDNNTAIGWYAGFYTSTGSTNTNAANSVFIGYCAYPNAVSETNQIVIGANAVGNGSNSVTIGDNNITKTILKGNIGLGTTTPSEKLVVSGNVQQIGRYSLYNNYISGFGGTGWKIDYGNIVSDKSFAEFDNLSIRGTFKVYELLVNQIRATNGSVFVSSASKIASAVLTSGTLGQDNSVYTLYIDANVTNANAIFAANDLIRAQRFTGNVVYQVNMQVSTITTSSFTAKLIGNNSYIDNINKFNGLEFVRIGNTTDASRQGSVYLTADDTYAPFIDIYDNVTSHTDFGNTSKVKVRLGKLSGVTSPTFGTLSGYGLWSTNVYLEGQIKATSGWIGGWNIVSDAIYTGTKGTNGNYTTDGITLGTVSSSGFLSSKQFYIDASGNAKFKGTAEAATISGSTILGGTITIGSNNDIFKVDSSGLYLGNATFASAPFRVNYSGYLVSSSGQIGGWNIVSDAIYNGTKGSDGAYTTNGITLGIVNTSGFLSAKQFLIDTAGNAKFKGLAEAATISGSTILGGTISIGSSNTVFKVDSSGLYLGNATFASAPFRVNYSGYMISSSGQIGGWNIVTDAIYTGTKGSNGAYTTDGITLGITNTSGFLSSKQFYIDTSGNAKFKGIAEAATISGSTILGGTISIGTGNTIFKVDSSGLYLGNTSFASAPFRVNYSGYMISSSGQIGGWNIVTDAIYTGTKGSNGAYTTDGITLGITNTSGFLSSKQFYIDTSGNAKFKGIAEAATISGSTIVGGTITIGTGNTIFKVDSSGLYLGNATFASAPFRVNYSGYMVASSGQIGGWNIVSDAIYTGTKGSNGAYTTDGITFGIVNTSGFISSKQFYIDAAGNAKFKGLVDAATISGALIVGGTISGVTGKFSGDVYTSYFETHPYSAGTNISNTFSYTHYYAEDVFPSNGLIDMTLYTIYPASGYLNSIAVVSGQRVSTSPQTVYFKLINGSGYNLVYNNLYTAPSGVVYVSASKPLTFNFLPCRWDASTYYNQYLSIAGGQYFIPADPNSVFTLSGYTYELMGIDVLSSGFKVYYVDYYHNHLRKFFDKTTYVNTPITISGYTQSVLEGITTKHVYPYADAAYSLGRIDKRYDYVYTQTLFGNYILSRDVYASYIFPQLDGDNSTTISADSITFAGWLQTTFVGWQNNKIYMNPKLYEFGGIVPANTLHGTYTEATIFNALVSYVPASGDKIMVTGRFQKTGETVVSYAQRTSDTVITLYGMDDAATLQAETVTSGNTTSRKITLAW